MSYFPSLIAMCWESRVLLLYMAWPLSFSILSLSYVLAVQREYISKILKITEHAIMIIFWSICFAIILGVRWVLYPTLCNSMDCSPPGSSVHGIFQARTPESVAIPLSRGSSKVGTEPESPCCRQIPYHLSHQGSTITGIS